MIRQLDHGRPNFHSDDVRLWLSLLAYDLGESVAAAGAAEESRKVDADEPAAAAGEN